ncbi:hypothetical protein BSZ07_36720 [Streptomyces sp. M1013]|uniref:hypothetical protein n=1 Tax=Streptomyces sp. M1013 TaxID=549798 RepID=UPI000978ECD7|nr:hypothetical protein [Streptomyces sp. M1013]OMI84792.1 hypothetical protein BSZ07_36720 [Streptomyces sp. M1013]
MISERALRGYLLEEVLAWLLRSSGYEVLTAQDDGERPPWKTLEVRNHGLVVRGRGAWHQADTLGQFRYVPPFSLPVRLFVEAKFTRTRVRLSTVRNGHGVVHDVNENVMTTVTRHSGPRRPRTRYRYSYAIFSTSGFSQDAQEFALAHQISLVDLSMPDFARLRTLVRTAAKDVHAAMQELPAASRPTVHALRTHLRGPLLDLWGQPAVTAPSVTAPLDVLAESLRSRSTLGLILAFPAAPFVLGLASDDLYGFVSYARRHPTHSVRLRRLRQPGPHPVWEIRSQDDPDAYALTFGLPEQVEAWILDQETSTSARTRWVKESMLSAMTLYWMDSDHAHTFQLRYAAAEIIEQRADDPAPWHLSDLPEPPIG